MPRRTRSRETTPEPAADASRPTGWRAYRREITFLVLFLVLLGAGFSFISWTPVNDAFVEPFTAGIARVSAVTLDAIGQDVTRSGTIITNERFAVNIRNGCNGLETVLIFLAAVLAFPASWKARTIGVVLGVAAIQVINLVRVVALFLTGAYWPDLFDASHTVIWQTVVILCGVLLWILWADRLARPTLQRDTPAAA